MKIILCEDSAEDQEKLLAILKSSRIPAECTVCSSGEELLKEYCSGEYDLILSDIYMGGITGIEAVSKIREFDEEIPVAFITTSKDFALEGYRLSALKYIEKPFCQKDLDEILWMAQLTKENLPSLILHKNGKEERLPFRNILFLEQQARQLAVHLKDGSVFQVYEKLSSILPQTENYDFFCSHKSYAVNLEFVQSIDSELRCFVMSSGQNVPIRRESMGKAKKALENFLFKSTRRDF